MVISKKWSEEMICDNELARADFVDVPVCVLYPGSVVELRSLRLHHTLCEAIVFSHAHSLSSLARHHLGERRIHSPGRFVSCWPCIEGSLLCSRAPAARTYQSIQFIFKCISVTIIVLLLLLLSLSVSDQHRRRYC